MKFLQKIILLLNIGVVIATLLAYISPIIDPELTWTISFFGLFYPVLLILNIVFSIFWIIQGNKYFWISLVCLLLGYSQIIKFITFSSSKIEENENALHVMTYNISNASFGYDKNKNNRNQKREAFQEFLKQYEDVDIFCVQEVGDYAFDILKKIYHKYYIYRKEKGAIIISKYPFIKKGEIDFGTITNSCLWADIKLPNDTIRVYSYHLQSNRISKIAEDLANQKKVDQKKTWFDIKGMLRKFRSHHLERSKQSEQIADHAYQSPYKIILAGDLNDPPQSYTYYVLSRLGNDAFTVRGNGIGTTYAGKIPLLRIDYVFADNAFSIDKFNIIKDNFSDHYAISTVISWD